MIQNINDLPLLLGERGADGMEALLGRMGTSGFNGIAINNNFESNRFIGFKSKFNNNDKSFSDEPPKSVFENDYKYQVVVKLFSTGTLLLNEYQRLKKEVVNKPENSNYGYFLLENTNGSDLFGSAFICAFGSNFKSTFRKVYNGSYTETIKAWAKGKVVYDRIDEGNIVAYFQKLMQDEVDQNINKEIKVVDEDKNNFTIPSNKKLKEMLELELNIDFTNDSFWKKLLKLWSKADEALANEIVALAKTVNKLQIDKTRYLKGKNYNPILPIADISNGVKGLAEMSKNASETFTKYRNVLQTHKAKLEKLNFSKGMGSKIISIIDLVLKSMENIFASVSNFFKNIIDDVEHILGIINAVICGIINGFLSLIEMVLQLVALFVDYVVGPALGMDIKEVKSLEDTILKLERCEALEDILDTLIKNWNALSEGFVKLMQDFNFADITKMIKDGYNKLHAFEIAYFVGNFIFEVISGVAITLLTGGAGAIAKAATTGQKIMVLLKMAIKEAIESATFGIIDIVKGLKKFIETFVSLANKGGKELYDYIIKLIRKLFGVDAVEAPDAIKKIAKVENDDIVVVGKRRKVKERQKKKNDDINRRLDERKYNNNDFERTVNGLLDKLDGLKYNKKELKLLKNQLKSKYGVQVKFVDKDYSLKHKLIDWDKRDVVGSFNPGPPPIMYLRSNNASELTVFHEKVHLEVWFNKMAKMNLIDEEKFVWDAIWKTKERWTKKELLASYNYVNKLVYDQNLLGNKIRYLANPEMENLKYTINH